MVKESDKRELMWVHPTFKRKLKADAAIRGMKLIPYTKELAFIKDDERPKFKFRL